MALIPKIYFLFPGQYNEITNMDGTVLWTDSKPEVMDKSSSVYLRKKCATKLAIYWQKRNSDQFSSDENSPTYKRSELLLVADFATFFFTQSASFSKFYR